MEAGVSGVHGQVAPRHVEQEQEAELEHVTTLLQLMGEMIVRDQVMSQEIVMQIPAKVQSNDNISSYVYNQYS